MRKIVGISRSGPAYVVRGADGALRLMPLADRWAAPALARVDIPRSGVAGSISLLAWLAYPMLDGAEARRRERAVQVLEGWHWRSLNRYGHVRKMDMPAHVKAIREDRTLGLVENVIGRVRIRLTAANDVLLPLALATTCDVTVHGKRPSAKWLSAVATARRQGDSQAEDYRKRVWMQSRPVLHLADELRVLISTLDDDGGDPWGRLLCRPDWVVELIDGAESRRCMELPALNSSIPTDQTIQFRPV